MEDFSQEEAEQYLKEVHGFQPQEAREYLSRSGFKGKVEDTPANTAQAIMSSFTDVVTGDNTPAIAAGALKLTPKFWNSDYAQLRDRIKSYNQGAKDNNPRAAMASKVFGFGAGMAVPTAKLAGLDKVIKSRAGLAAANGAINGGIMGFLQNPGDVPGKTFADDPVAAVGRRGTNALVSAGLGSVFGAGASKIGDTMYNHAMRKVRADLVNKNTGELYPEVLQLLKDYEITGSKEEVFEKLNKLRDEDLAGVMNNIGQKLDNMGVKNNVGALLQKIKSRMPDPELKRGQLDEIDAVDQYFQEALGDGYMPKEFRKKLAAWKWDKRRFDAETKAYNAGQAKATTPTTNLNVSTKIPFLDKILNLNIKTPNSTAAKPPAPLMAYPEKEIPTTALIDLYRDTALKSSFKAKGAGGAPIPVNKKLFAKSYGPMKEAVSEQVEQKLGQEGVNAWEKVNKDWSLLARINDTTRKEAAQEVSNAGFWESLLGLDGSGAKILSKGGLGAMKKAQKGTNIPRYLLPLEDEDRKDER